MKNFTAKEKEKEINNTNNTNNNKEENIRSSRSKVKKLFYFILFKIPQSQIKENRSKSSTAFGNNNNNVNVNTKYKKNSPEKFQKNQYEVFCNKIMEDNNIKDFNSLIKFFEKNMKNVNSNKEKINNVRYLLKKSKIIF